MKKKIEKEEKPKREKKAKLVIPEEYKVFPDNVKNILIPIIHSNDFRERLEKTLRIYAENDYTSSRESEKQFLDSLYESYHYIKNTYAKALSGKEAKVEKKDIKLTITDQVRIDMRMKYIKGFYKDKSEEDLFDFLIWQHLYILVEGELKLSVGEDVYCNEIVNHLNKKKQ